MNELITGLILAVVQGIAEWVPISSSGHLVLLSKILGYSGDLTFFVALHFGTLMAIFVYFGKDIMDIVETLMKREWKSDNGRLGIMLGIAAIPAGIAGIIFHYFIGESSNLLLLSIGLAITAVVLFIGSIDFSWKKNLTEIGYKSALLIGLAQILSLFRGVSRSGTTISTGLLLGLKEKEAVKFSFLLSIPIVLGANVLELGNKTLSTDMFWATLVSFLVGICTIHLSFTYILNNKKNLRWIGAYVLTLAVMVFVYSILT